MKDWRTMIEAGGFGIPAEEADRVAGPLGGLEASFRPLVQDLPPELEPDLLLRPEEEE